MNAKEFLIKRGYCIEAIECHDRNLTEGKINLPELMEEYAKERNKTQ